MTKSTTPLTDDDLLAAARADPSAFEAIFDRHFDVIFRFAAHRIGRQAAEDIAAETFVRAFAAIDRAHTTDGSLRAWLYAIANNLIRDDLRRAGRAGIANARLQRAAQADADHSAAAIGSEAPDPALLAAVQTLRAEEQEALLLHAWGELSYVEIAAATGVAIGTVRSRLHRARTTLQSALQPRPTEPTR